MPKYRYIVINQDNRQLTGTIGAPDEANARNELNELGFSVIAIENIPEDELAEGVKGMAVFEFAAIDKNQKKVIGTIQGPDQYSAYKRLISEYEFSVEYVIDNALPEAQKETERQKGSFELQTRLGEELMPTKAKMSGDEKDLKEFERKQEVLGSQINFVLSKVKSILDQYEKDMKPETKQKIKAYVEKILRIKSSTNLDYIRKTAEELLEYLQKEELFLFGESKSKERTKMVVEAKSLMMHLRQGSAKKSLSIEDTLRHWRKEHIVEKSSPSGLDKFLDFFISKLIGANRETQEVVNIKKEITVTNNQLKQYLILYFQSPTPEFKAEAKEGLKRIWAERKRLKKLLLETERRIQEQRIAQGIETGGEKILHELLAFTGWLLTFYLIYYFVSIYLTSKDFGDLRIPGVFYIFRSGFLKYFLATLFLFHAAISIKFNFFRKNEAAVLIITPVFLMGSLLIYLNF